MDAKIALKYQDKDIHKRIYNFVIRVIKFTRLLPRTPENIVLIHQLVKSASSMGANDHEADAAESKNDFLAKYSIVKKETNESIFWLEVIRDTNATTTQFEAKELISECIEIYRIIKSIIIKIKHKGN